MDTPTNWEELVAEANKDRRFTKRIPLAFPIQVAGLDRLGHFFSERTVTADVSDSGCRFHLKASVEPGTTVAVKLLNRTTGEPYPFKPLLFEIRWIARDVDGWQAGACGLQSGDLWRVAFQPQKTEEPSPA